MTKPTDAQDPKRPKTAASGDFADETVEPAGSDNTAGGSDEPERSDPTESTAAGPSDADEESPADRRDEADERAESAGSMTRSGSSGAPSGAEAGSAARDAAKSSLPPPWQRVPESVGSTSGDRSFSSPAVAASTQTTDHFGEARTVTMRPATAAPPGQREAEEPEAGAGSRPGARQPSPPGGFPMSWPRGRRPRRANLQLKRLDPWSVLKIALVLAVVVYLVWLIAVGVLYGVLGGMGVWDRLNGQYADLVAEQGGDQLISAGRVFGVALILGAVQSLLVAVAISVGAFIYNTAADLVGGIEVTLSERD